MLEEQEPKETKDSPQAETAEIESASISNSPEFDQKEKPFDEDNDVSKSSSSHFLTFREIEVASKAAMKWLQFVDDRIVAREAEKIEKNKIIQRRLSMGLKLDSQPDLQRVETGEEDGTADTEG